jgi:hypothetical protein
LAETGSADAACAADDIVGREFVGNADVPAAAPVTSRPTRADPAVAAITGDDSARSVGRCVTAVSAVSAVAAGAAGAAVPAGGVAGSVYVGASTVTSVAALGVTVCAAAAVTGGGMSGAMGVGDATGPAAPTESTVGCGSVCAVACYGVAPAVVVGVASVTAGAADVLAMASGSTGSADSVRCGVGTDDFCSAAGPTFAASGSVAVTYSARAGTSVTANATSRSHCRRIVIDECCAARSAVTADVSIAAIPTGAGANFSAGGRREAAVTAFSANRTAGAITAGTTKCGS